ncbi:hypothetical protein ATY76_13415 [Rhizobium sp. R339]|uniref:hypothetical protein n=1 Tax=Rhizobium sp. R339 TaxID=1764273 RepID=UPI000B52C891|nr:hypothetical protein [Rhizobium sp. R339]OWV67921.1 hypothetical protein ATY76_13415 [Rhizobium sp. R339]
MRDALPLVDILAGREKPSEWASWLQRCPIGIIHREQVAIRTILKDRGFAAGVEYLDALLAFSNATRLPDGGYPQTVVMAVHMAAGAMRDAARAAEGAE